MARVATYFSFFAIFHCCIYISKALRFDLNAKKIAQQSSTGLQQTNYVIEDYGDDDAVVSNVAEKRYQYPSFETFDFEERKVRYGKKNYLKRLMDELYRKDRKRVQLGDTDDSEPHFLPPRFGRGSDRNEVSIST